MRLFFGSFLVFALQGHDDLRARVALLPPAMPKRRSGFV